jgi:FKBP12-rapamycin complex-associated protein
MAIDELGMTKSFGESVSRLSELIRILMDAFSSGTDVSTMEYAASTLGRLVRAGGASLSDVVEDQVKRGLQWLAGPRTEHARLAGVIVLQELANAAPAVFNVHVRSFIEVIWNPLRDPKPSVRITAVDALRACLVLVEKRETRYRVQWYYRLFEETQRGLTRVTSIETVHGSLLALGELLSHTGEFMLARYREVCETVLRIRDSKEKLLRRAVITLLPRLAAFAPERFVRSYLKQATEHLLSVLTNPAERGAGFMAVGEMSLALASAGVAVNMKSPIDFLRPIASQIYECLTSRTRNKSQHAEALECAGTLCLALRKDWQPHMEQLLEPAVATGLSDALVRSLGNAVDALPELLPRVQSLLLDLISLVLARKPLNSSTPAATVSVLQAALVNGEMQGPALIRLALQTLGNFTMVPHALLDFVRDHVMIYLDDIESQTRRVAAIATCKIMERQMAYVHRSDYLGSTTELRAVDSIVQRLLVSGVADPALSVRRTIFELLAETSALDQHIGQAEALRTMFVAFNDEFFPVRSLAIRLAGHISEINPAYVRPALRRHLLQLLNDMDHSPDSRQREESARLLGVLIKSAPKLILPYTFAILRTLLTKLRAAYGANNPSVSRSSNSQGSNKSSQLILVSASGSSEEGFRIALLDTLGDLVVVAGKALQEEVSEMMPLIIEALGDASNPTKRLVAVKTLEKVVKSTGCVVLPYLEYPQLLGILLRMLGEGNLVDRREVSRVLGVIGALDPHMHKLNLAELQGEGKLEREGVRPQFPGKQPPGIDMGTYLGGFEGGGTFLDLLPSSGLVTSSEDYYPTVAINALMRILRDPALNALHGRAVLALFQIVKSMGLGFVPYLPKVVPIILSLTRSADDIGRRIEMIKALTELVVFMRQHVRRYLGDLLAIVDVFWNESGVILPHILKLLGELSRK